MAAASEFGERRKYVYGSRGARWAPSRVAMTPYMSGRRSLKMPHALRAVATASRSNVAVTKPSGLDGAGSGHPAATSALRPTWIRCKRGVFLCVRCSRHGARCCRRQQTQAPFDQQHMLAFFIHHKYLGNDLAGGPGDETPAVKRNLRGLARLGADPVGRHHGDEVGACVAALHPDPVGVGVEGGVLWLGANGRRVDDELWRDGCCACLWVGVGNVDWTCRHQTCICGMVNNHNKLMTLL